MSDTDARLRPTPATLAPAVDNAAYFADAIRSIGALYSVAAYLADLRSGEALLRVEDGHRDHARVGGEDGVVGLLRDRRRRPGVLLHERSDRQAGEHLGVPPRERDPEGRRAVIR